MSTCQQTPPAPRKRSALWLILAVFVTAVVILAVLGALAMQRGAEPLQVAGAQLMTLDDGTELFVKVTYGTTHNWQATVGQERSLSNLFTATRTVDHQYTSSSPDYCIWLTGMNPRTRKPYDFSWWAYSSVVDQYGQEVRDEHARRYITELTSYGSSGNSSSGITRPMDPYQEQATVIVASSDLPPFHTNQNNFTLRFHDTTGKVVGQVQVPVAHSQPKTPWQPDSLPAAKQAGDLAVTLKGIEFIDLNPSDDHLQQPALHVRLDLQYVWQDQPSQAWQATGMVADSLGNQDSVSRVRLSPHAPAWKLQLALVRNDDALFTPEEMWQPPELPLLAADTHERLNHAGTAKGVNFVVQVISGAGKVSYGIPVEHNLGGSSSSSGSLRCADNRTTHYHVDIDYRNQVAQVEVQAEAPHMTFLAPLESGQQLIVRAVDDQGRKVPTTIRDYQGIVVVLLGTAIDAKSVQATVIVNEEREVEFLIEPPQASTEGSSP